MAACDCRFCSINDGKYKYGEVDSPLIANDNYYVIPSIGDLVKAGWTLIVPKKHVYSMKQLFCDPCLYDIIKETTDALRQKYGKVLIFEHGASKEGSLTACGTEHAHLHLVPFEGSLYEDIENSGLGWTTCQAFDIARLSGNSEYLFYTELDIFEKWENHVGKLHILDAPTSQFFRKLIAKRKGVEQQVDYNAYPFIDAALRTRNDLIRFF